MEWQGDDDWLTEVNRKACIFSDNCDITSSIWTAWLYWAKYHFDYICRLQRLAEPMLFSTDRVRQAPKLHWKANQKAPGCPARTRLMRSMRRIKHCHQDLCRQSAHACDPRCAPHYRWFQRSMFRMSESKTLVLLRACKLQPEALVMSFSFCFMCAWESRPRKQGYPTRFKHCVAVSAWPVHCRNVCYEPSRALASGSAVQKNIVYVTW